MMHFTYEVEAQLLTLSASDSILSWAGESFRGTCDIPSNVALQQDKQKNVKESRVWLMGESQESNMIK